MLDGELSATDYREIKGRYEPEIEQLERKKRGIVQVDANLFEYVSVTADLLRNLPNYHITASLPNIHCFFEAEIRCQTTQEKVHLDEG